MFKRISMALAIVLILFLVSGAWMSTSAKDAVVPFKGGYVTYPVFGGFDPQGCAIQNITGEGYATHLGLNTWSSQMHGCQNPVRQTGWVEFTAGNGDLLQMDLLGEPSFSPGIVTFWGGYTITGGTGRFENAGGTGNYWGSASLTPGETGEIYFEGTLEKP